MIDLLSLYSPHSGVLIHRSSYNLWHHPQYYISSCRRPFISQRTYAPCRSGQLWLPEDRKEWLVIFKFHPTFKNNGDTSSIYSWRTLKVDREKRIVCEWAWCALINYMGKWCAWTFVLETVKHSMLLVGFEATFSRHMLSSGTVNYFWRTKYAEGSRDW